MRPTAPPDLLTHESASALLRNRGIMPTQQRVEIARLLLARAQHFCADTLLERVNQTAELAVSKATVYNTLRLFADKGLIREVIVEPTKTFYDSNTQPHHHFYDAEMGALTDIPPESVVVTGIPAPPAGLVVDGVDVVVRVSTEKSL